MTTTRETLTAAGATVTPSVDGVTGATQYAISLPGSMPGSTGRSGWCTTEDECWARLSASATAADLDLARDTLARRAAKAAQDADTMRAMRRSER